MPKLLIKLALFVVPLLCLDYLFSYVLKQGRPIDYDQFLSAKIDFFQDVDSIDLLILGDSHVADALDPRIIERKAGLTSYNLGVYHSSPYETYYLAKSALTHLARRPKLVVLGTNPVMFERPLSRGKYTPLILPRLGSVPLWWNSEEGLEGSFFIQTIQEKYLLKSLIGKILGKTYEPTRVVEDVYNGHLKFHNQIPGSKWSGFDSTAASTHNLRQVDYFTKTVELFRQHDIPVILVHPPILPDHLIAMSESESFKVFSTAIRGVTESYRLKSYFNYKTGDKANSLSLVQSNFLNSQHLNYSGSALFTDGFVRFLEERNVVVTPL